MGNHMFIIMPIAKSVCASLPVPGGAMCLKKIYYENIKK
jgi:hypothetical protein